METKLNITANGDTITLLQGSAPTQLPLKEPQVINIMGEITAPGNFLSKRYVPDAAILDQDVSKDEALLLVSKANRTITLKTNPVNAYGHTVVGALKMDADLTKFKINEEHYFEKKDLLKLIKFNRAFFNDKEDHNKLLAGLQNIRIKTEQELANENDSRGNKAVGFTQKVTGNNGLPTKFSLFMPIWQGFAAVNFEVELCFDVNGTQLVFWLESPQLAEHMATTLDAIFEAQLAQWKDELVVIYQ